MGGHRRFAGLPPPVLQIALHIDHLKPPPRACSARPAARPDLSASSAACRAFRISPVPPDPGGCARRIQQVRHKPGLGADEWGVPGGGIDRVRAPYGVLDDLGGEKDPGEDRHEPDRELRRGTIPGPHPVQQRVADLSAPTGSAPLPDSVRICAHSLCMGSDRGVVQFRNSCPDGGIGGGAAWWVEAPEAGGAGGRIHAEDFQPEARGGGLDGGRGVLVLECLAGLGCVDGADQMRQGIDELLRTTGGRFDD